MTRTVWKKGDDGKSCVHCGLTWDMHLCDGESTCPRTRPAPLDIPLTSNPMSPQLAGLVNRLQEWSRNCLIDGLKMDQGEPTLQDLLREAYLTLMRQSAHETTREHQAIAIDAARYQWLRTNVHAGVTVLFESKIGPEGPEGFDYNEEYFDEAIDKLMAASSEKTTTEGGT